MIEYENIPVTKYEQKAIKIVCDLCEMSISRANGHKVYYEVTMHHNHWDNDSGDSYEHEEICSIKCLTEHMSNYYKDKDEDGLFYEVETDSVYL